MGFRRLFASSCVAALAIVAVGCGGSDEDSSEGGSTGADISVSDSVGLSTEPAGSDAIGGSLIVGLEANWRPLDPADMGALVDRNLAAAIYDPLIGVNEDGDFIPALATDWEVSDDAKTFTLTLREGVLFHDGTQFDAEAVKSQFDRLTDPATICRCAADVEVIAAVETIDDYTVEFTLSSPSAAFLAVLADVPGMIASPTAVEAAGREDFALAPIGAGPFKVVQLVDNDNAVLERFDDYWEEGLPLLDEITYRPIPDNQSRYAALQSGDIDIMQSPSVENVVDSRDNDDYEVVELGGLGTTFVMYQSADGPFADPRARRAVALASDMDTMNESLYLGQYEHATSVFPDSMNLDIDVPNYPTYDLEAARDLVDELGGLSFTLQIQAVPGTLEAAEVLQAMWADAGITATIEQYDQPTLIDNALNSSFEGMIFRWPGRWDPDLNSYQFFHSGSTRNYVQLSDPELDGLLDKGRSTIDPDERKDLYQQAAVLLGENPPYNFMYELNGFFLTRSNISGVPAIADWLLRPHTIAKS